MWLIEKSHHLPLARILVEIDQCDTELEPRHLEQLGKITVVIERGKWAQIEPKAYSPPVFSTTARISEKLLKGNIVDNTVKSVRILARYCNVAGLIAYLFADL